MAHYYIITWKDNAKKNNVVKKRKENQYFFLNAPI